MRLTASLLLVVFSLEFAVVPPAYATSGNRIINPVRAFEVLERENLRFYDHTGQTRLTPREMAEQNPARYRVYAGDDLRFDYRRIIQNGIPRVSVAAKNHAGTREYGFTSLEFNYNAQDADSIRIQWAQVIRSFAAEVERNRAAQASLWQKAIRYVSEVVSITPAYASFDPDGTGHALTTATPGERRILLAVFAAVMAIGTASFTIERIAARSGRGTIAGVATTALLTLAVWYFGSSAADLLTEEQRSR
jgi:hypothetical protein